MSFNIQTHKSLSSENVKRIIALGLSLKDVVTGIEQKCLEEYDESKTYIKDKYVTYNNYIYKAKTTTTGSFDESKWIKIGDDLSLVTIDDIKSMINLTDEEIANLQSLISTEIRLDKCFSSSDTYNRILNATNECKTFTMEQLAKKAGVVYKVVADTTGVDSTEFLYLISNGSNGYNIYAYIDGSAVKISDTNINLDSYAKLTDLDDYVKKTDATATYATITTVDGKVDKTSILSAISSTPSDDKLLSEKAIDDTFVKKTDITTTIDSTSTDEQVPSAMAVYDKLSNSYVGYSTIFNKDFNTVIDRGEYYAVGCTNSPINNSNGYLKVYRCNASYCLQEYSPSDKPYRYIREQIAGTWTKWQRLCTTSSVADVPWTQLTLDSGMGGNMSYRIKNGICYVNVNDLHSSTMSTKNQTIVIGLPIPETTNAWYQLISNTATEGGLLVNIDNTGKMTNYAGLNNAVYFGTFSYPV